MGIVLYCQRTVFLILTRPTVHSYNQLELSDDIKSRMAGSGIKGDIKGRQTHGIGHDTRLHSFTQSQGLARVQLNRIHPLLMLRYTCVWQVSMFTMIQAN